MDRTLFQLRSSGAKHDSLQGLRTGLHDRGYLPHIKREGATYFVTFRLADSLPREVLLQLERERAERLQALQNAAGRPDPVKHPASEASRDFQRQVERYLDRGAGACHLRNAEVAGVVAQALLHFNDIRYVLREWVIMPNHVHAVVWPLPNTLLSGILKSWKQFTSRRAKRILGLWDEPFWQPESYDHWIRNDEERARITRYVRNNPVTAGLCKSPEDWRWGSAWSTAHPPA